MKRGKMATNLLEERTRDRIAFKKKKWVMLTFPCSFNLEKVSDIPRDGDTLREAIGEREFGREMGLNEA